MVSRAAVEAAPFLAVALLLPLHLLSFAVRPRLSPSAAPPRVARSVAAQLTAAALLTAVYAVPDSGVPPGAAAGADVEAMQLEIDALRLKVARLESMLDENTRILNSKASILEKDSNLIEAMEQDIQLLMDQQEITKKSESKSYYASNIKAMEYEVQKLEQEVRKINSNAYTIESIASNAEKRVEALSSEVKKMEDIISEQWIQIRQFEQAFVVTKMMASRVHERSRSSDTVNKLLGKDSILKYVRSVNLNGFFLRGASYARSCFSHAYKQCRSFVQAMNGCYHEASRFRRAIHRQYIPDNSKPNAFFLGGSISRSCISRPYNHFRTTMSSAQKFHHKRPSVYRRYDEIQQI
ncbi:hypothetical protein ACP70R_022168 [Stipagrostis hirtigluma subsp. patula]